VCELGEAGEPELSRSGELEADDLPDVSFASRDERATFREVQAPGWWRSGWEAGVLPVDLACPRYAYDGV